MRFINWMLAILVAGVFYREVWADSTEAPENKTQAFPTRLVFQEQTTGKIKARWIPRHNEILANVNGTLEIINPENGAREVIMEGLSYSDSSHLELSPDGERVILDADDSTFIFHLKTREKIEIAGVSMQGKKSGDDLLKTYFFVGPVRWSPDGTKIVYEIYDNGIFIINADGSGNKKLLKQNNVSLLNWSKTGDRIAIVLLAPSRRDVVTITPDGKDIKPLVDKTELIKWFPDNDTFCFAREGFLYMKKTSVKAIKLIGSFDGKSAAEEHGPYDFEISPDGKKVAFLYNVYKDKDEKKADRVSSSLAESETIGFPADFFRSSRVDREIIVYDVDSDSIINVTNTPNKWEWGPQWSPDNRQLMVMQGEKDDDPKAVPVIVNLMPH